MYLCILIFKLLHLNFYLTYEMIFLIESMGNLRVDRNRIIEVICSFIQGILGLVISGKYRNRGTYLDMVILRITKFIDLFLSTKSGLVFCIQHALSQNRCRSNIFNFYIFEKLYFTILILM